MIERFLTTEQVANILQVHPFTILKFLKNGKLRGIKLGRVYRIQESEVKRFLESRAAHDRKIEVKIQDEPEENGEIPEETSEPEETAVSEQTPQTPSEEFKLTQDKKNEDHYII